MGIIEDLRKKAELNFCERCFQEYKAMIEPTIQGLLLVPLADWRQIESEITQMVMKNEGIFKSKSIIISLGVDEKENSEVVDVQAFVKIKRWSFSHKIKYLHKNGILQNSSYQLLDKARETRNRLHELFGFSQQDYALFRVAYVITNQLLTAMMIEQKDIGDWLKSDAEKAAEQCLKKLH